jgi:hypothetical protein
MSWIESLGTVFEGSLFARALEPKAGEAKADEPYQGTCLNCGAERVGPHCHRCGQKAHIHTTMREFLHDLVHGTLHVEGKTFRTVPLLFWRPGQLTRRYIDGERARFVSPMALFLFSVFLMFAVFQLAGLTPPSDLGAVGSGDDPELTSDDLEGLKGARAAMGDDNPAAPILDKQIEAAEKSLVADSAPQKAGAGPGPADEFANGLVDGAKGPGDPVVLAQGQDGGRLTTRYTGIGFLDGGIEKWRENPSLMAYKLQSNFYKFSWLLIPLSLPFVWLLFFWKRRPRFGMYDHAVFVTYSLSFMTLFYVALVLLSAVGVSASWLALLGVFVPLLHIYKQLKGTYALRRFSALWRTAVLTVFIFVILFLFLDVLLVIGAVG